MSDSQQMTWTDNPNAPRIPYYLYLQEKAYFAGILIASILYGILTVLFFQCITGLLNPANRRRAAIKWGLVSYTVVMFLVATVLTGMGLNLGSISFIDNREFPGIEDVLAPGPLGYQVLIRSSALRVVPSFTFLLNYWLADGLLLYRCYVIYAANLWAIAFPCLMYLGSWAMGLILVISMAHGLDSYWSNILNHSSIPCISISVSLNVLLTLMIVIRLIVHSRNLRAATGSSAGISGLCKAIATMLIESSALYAVNSLVLIALWVAGNNAAGAFIPILAETQVIAPLLIIKRVANQSALTSSTVVTGHHGSFHVGSRGDSSIGHSGPLPDEHPMSPADKYGDRSGELEVGVGVETTVDFHRDSKV